MYTSAYLFIFGITIIYIMILPYTSSFLKQSFIDLNIMVGDSNIVSSNSARNLGVIFSINV